MSPSSILIVGAGPTGLALALRLSHHGVPFRIVDKNAGPGLASRAMAMHARTLEFYRQLDLAETIVENGVRIETVHLRENGEDVAKLVLKDLGAGLSPYPFVLAYPQDDHERFLVGELEKRGVHVEWNTALASFSQDDDKVTVTLSRGANAGGGASETFDVAYLCGCDGAHSRVREGLGLDFPGGTYPHHYYVADVRIEGDTSTDAYMNLGADAFALRLPVRSSGMTRLIGMMPASADDKAHPTFEDVRSEAEPLLKVKVAEVNWFSSYRVHHRVAAKFRVGRCFIAGDAGHVHSPTGGQGMNTGIGDAVNLSWKLAHVLQGRADPSLLDTYEAERIKFARSLVATTDRAFQAIVSPGWVGKLVRTVVFPHALPFLTGFAAARRLMFKTVSQVEIDYEASTLSAGKAGDWRGGDRLPWVATAGGDNFEALRSLDWQLHVYGSANTALRTTADDMGLRIVDFAWSEAADAAGLKRDAAYLVRPDGYIALALPDQDASELSAYTAKFGLKFRALQPA